MGTSAAPHPPPLPDSTHLLLLLSTWHSTISPNTSKRLFSSWELMSLERFRTYTTRPSPCSGRGAQRDPVTAWLPGAPGWQAPRDSWCPGHGAWLSEWHQRGLESERTGPAGEGGFGGGKVTPTGSNCFLEEHEQRLGGENRGACHC